MKSPTDAATEAIAEKLEWLMEEHYSRARMQIRPLVEMQLAQERAAMKPKIVHVVYPELMKAARGVAEAADELERAKYTRGEIAARQSLERRARALKSALERFRK